MLVYAICQVLTKSGRDDQASMVTVAGVVIVLFMLVSEMGALFESVRDIFGL